MVAGGLGDEAAVEVFGKRLDRPAAQARLDMGQRHPRIARRERPRQRARRIALDDRQRRRACGDHRRQRRQRRGEEAGGRLRRHHQVEVDVGLKTEVAERRAGEIAVLPRAADRDRVVRGDRRDDGGELDRFGARAEDEQNPARRRRAPAHAANPMQSL